MKKFAGYVYGECKEIVFGRSPIVSFATGSFLTYLHKRTWRKIKGTQEVDLEFVKQTSESVKMCQKIADISRNVDKRLEEHAETLGLYGQLKVRSALA